MNTFNISGTELKTESDKVGKSHLSPSWRWECKIRKKFNCDKYYVQKSVNLRKALGCYKE